MEILKENMTIKLTDGRKVKVGPLLGEGAQGAVFKATVDGIDYALKWYKQSPSEKFVGNLNHNVAEGAPSPQFLWPVGVTRHCRGSIGYLMPLRPEGFYEFSKFRLAKVRFGSLRAIINAAIETCIAFKHLHAKGLSFQDINDGGFFINPQDGRVLICDCDNVFPHGDNSGILGKARYTAPEIVKGERMPDSYSDRFSMCVMLFMFFCIDHPFEGINVVRRPCMTEAIERCVFGDEICFIFDPDNTKNRPVRNIHRNAIALWDMVPHTIKSAFIEEFSLERILKPESRRTEMQWVDIFCRVRDKLTLCPKCGDEIVADGVSKCLNSSCNTTYLPELSMISGNRKISMLNGTLVYFSTNSSVSGAVFSKPGEPSKLLIKNLTDQNWSVTTPLGKTIEVAPGSFMPVKRNLQISVAENNTPIKFQIQ